MYAWIEYRRDGSQVVHTKVVATGADRTVAVTSDFDWPAWRPEGIYLVHHRIGTDEAKDGLVLLDPSAGRWHDVPVPDFTSPTEGWRIQGATAWVSEFAPGEAVSRFHWDELVGYDLARGTTTVWYHAAGHPVTILGVDDQGRPIIWVATVDASGSVTATEILVLSQPGTVFRTLSSGTMSQSRDADAFEDAQGIWVVGTGVYLARPGQMLTAISSRTLNSAGPCR